MGPGPVGRRHRPMGLLLRRVDAVKCGGRTLSSLSAGPIRWMPAPTCPRLGRCRPAFAREIASVDEPLLRDGIEISIGRVDKRRRVAAF